ncbi:TOBE domain-containing protein [Williamsia muralis]|uniref:TOBE domain-containing protein n=1 Tax=Williamsia marianensis TaxID=85044 RepID=UPI001670CD72
MIDSAARAADHRQVGDLKIRQAAELLGISDDTVRRMISGGQLPAHVDGSGRQVVDGTDLAKVARDRAPEVVSTDAPVARSARNRFVGLVTDVRSDPVMSQVTLQCGPFEVTSLMSTDAVNELGLRPGEVATAVVKATTVIVETRTR